MTLSGGSVCEGAGFVTVRVQLDSDIETDVIVSLETSDLTAEGQYSHHTIQCNLYTVDLSRVVVPIMCMYFTQYSH